MSRLGETSVLTPNGRRRHSPPCAVCKQHFGHTKDCAPGNAKEPCHINKRCTSYKGTHGGGSCSPHAYCQQWEGPYVTIADGPHGRIDFRSGCGKRAVGDRADGQGPACADHLEGVPA